MPNKKCIKVNPNSELLFPQGTGWAKVSLWFCHQWSGGLRRQVVKGRCLFEVLTFPNQFLYIFKPPSPSLAQALDSPLHSCSCGPVLLFNEILRLVLPAFSLASDLCMADFGSTKIPPTLSSMLPWPPIHVSIIWHHLVLMSLQHLTPCKVTLFAHLFNWLISVSPL